MAFRLIVHWPSNHILPTSYDCETARAALQKHRDLIDAGTSFVAILSVQGGETVRIVAATELVKLARAESRRRARSAIASTLLGLLASALPNGFGDFDVVSARGGAGGQGCFSRIARRRRA